MRQSLLLLLAATAGLWLLRAIAGTYGIFVGTPFSRILEITSVSVTAVLLVAVGSWVITEIVVGLILRVRPTGVHRAVVYGILTVVALTWVFSSFGVDVTAIVTTSAVFAAATGLALQPTLGGLIAGIIMHGEVMLRRGDVMLLDNQLLAVESFGWRSVIARPHGGGHVVIPNSKIVDQELRVYARSEPIALDSVFPAPLNVAPERIERLVHELVSDMAVVEEPPQVIVLPDSFDVLSGFVRYRVRYWVRDVQSKPVIDSEVLLRIWHGFQRERIPWPVSHHFDPYLHDWGAMIAPAGARDGAEDILLYSPGERIVVPDRHRRSRFRLVRGELRMSGPTEVLSANLGRAVPWTETAPVPPEREAALRRISDRLADDIGPYAELAVSAAALGTASIDQVINMVSLEIEDEAGRRRFLEALPKEGTVSLLPGFSFTARIDGTGRFVSEPPTRAATYSTIAVSAPDLTTG